MRMGLESHCRCFDAERRGLFFEQAQQADMADMDAIKIADGHY